MSGLMTPGTTAAGGLRPTLRFGYLSLLAAVLLTSLLGAAAEVAESPVARPPLPRRGRLLLRRPLPRQPRRRRHRRGRVTSLAR